MTNKHLLDFLQLYTLSKPAKYAVMVKGPWGVGKTTFVKNKIIKDKNTNYLYVSLYGVRSIKDIQEKIFSSYFDQLSPGEDDENESNKINLVLSKLPLINKVLGKGVKSALGKTPFIGTLLENIQPPIQFFIDNFVKNKVLIFDDVERSSIEIEDLMGYINSFVEHKGIHTLLIVNTDELHEKAEVFKKYKEKIIGREFLIQTNPKTVVSQIIKDLPDLILSKYNKDITELICTIYSKSELQNYRILGYAISNLSICSKSFLNEFNDHKNIILDIIKEFTILYIEHHSGNIDLNSSTIIENMLPDNNMLEKYDLSYLQFYDHNLLRSLILGKSILDDHVREQIKEVRSTLNEKKDEWEILWSYVNLTQDEFNISYAETLKKWKSKKFDNINIIIHVYLTFISLINNNLIALDKKSLSVEFKEYIDHVIKKNLLPEEYYRTLQKNFKGSHGLGWHTLNAEIELELVNKMMLKASKINMDSHHSNIIKNSIINNLKHEDIDTTDLINYSLKDENGNSKIAYLHKIKKDDFFKILISSSRLGIYKIERALQYRYVSFLNQSTHEISKEINWLQNLLKYINDYVEKIIEENHGINTISGYNLMNFKENIEKVIKDYLD